MFSGHLRWLTVFGLSEKTILLLNHGQGGVSTISFLFDNRRETVCLLWIYLSRVSLSLIPNRVLDSSKMTNKRPMGHNLLTCIFVNGMQESSSIATATGTQLWPYHKTFKGHPSLTILTNLVDLEFPMLYTKIQSQNFLRNWRRRF